MQISAAFFSKPAAFKKGYELVLPISSQTFSRPNKTVNLSGKHSTFPPVPSFFPAAVKRSCRLVSMAAIVKRHKIKRLPRAETNL